MTDPQLNQTTPANGESLTDAVSTESTAGVPLDHFNDKVLVPTSFFISKRDDFRKTECIVNASRTICAFGVLSFVFSFYAHSQICEAQSAVYALIAGSAFFCPSRSWDKLYSTKVTDEQQAIEIPHQLQKHLYNLQKWSTVCGIQTTMSFFTAIAMYLLFRSDPLSMVVAGLCAALCTGWLFIIMHERI